MELETCGNYGNFLIYRNPFTLSNLPGEGGFKCIQALLRRVFKFIQVFTTEQRIS